MMAQTSLESARKERDYAISLAEREAERARAKSEELERVRKDRDGWRAAAYLAASFAVIAGVGCGFLLWLVVVR